MAAFGAAASVRPVDEGRGLVFDGVAEDYDRVRSAYPDELVDHAVAAGKLGAGSRVLEIGCGTGKLTRALVARGLRVDAVDPGAQMIAVARRSVPEGTVVFHVGRFEKVSLPTGAFDGAFSATAFHWLDPAVSWRKVAGLLRPGGLLALVTHASGASDMGDEFLAAWREFVPEAPKWQYRGAEEIRAGVEARRDNVSEVWAWLTFRGLGRREAASWFEPAEIATWPVEREETADEALALVRTTSSYLALDPLRRAGLEGRLAAAIARAGGSFRSTMHAVLVTARRAERRAS